MRVEPQKQVKLVDDIKPWDSEVCFKEEAAFSEDVRL